VSQPAVRVAIKMLRTTVIKGVVLDAEGEGQSNATVVVGVDDDKVDAAIELIRENCRERSQYMTPMPPMVEPGEFFMPYPVEVQVGGATVFVVPVERFEKL